MYGIALALTATTLGAGVVSAAVNPAAYGALHWRSIGPFRGGRVLAVAGAGDSRLHFYFGAVNGGVWETKDAGRTWAPIFDGAPVESIGALAVAPSAPSVLYVGTGEADMRSDIAQGAGMFKSVDGGKTWAASGLSDSQAIARILIDPRDPDVVLVAALGHPYGPNAQRGVFRSTDGGGSWTRTLYKDADTGAIDLKFKPGDPMTVYAALWQTRRPPWNVYGPSSGPGGGLYKSADGGVTWAKVAGLPQAPGRIGLAVAPSAPDRLYALVDTPKDPKAGGLWRSDDNGVTWTHASGDKRIWERGWYFGELAVDPRNPDRVWVGDTILIESDDGGKTFRALKGDFTGNDFHVLWIDPADPDRRIVGADQGALVTLNGGATWSSWYNQPTGQFYHVATDDRFPYRVYGAQQDSGAADVPSRTGSWDGIDMTNFHGLTVGGESDSIAPDPADPEIIYGGRVNRLDLRTGQVRHIDPTLAFPDDYRETWTLPLIFGPDGKSLYFSNQRVFRTRDGGAHWTPISPDLTRPDPGVPPNLGADASADPDGPGKRKGVVYTLAPSPLANDDIWAGTDDGLVWRTLDGGRIWVDVTPPGLAAWSKVGGIEPSHFDANVAYLAIDRHRLDDFAPYVWRTADGGKSWASIAAGLAETVNVVREDPKRRGLLYAGTESGAFVSLDDGAHWSPLKSGLPATSVRDLTVHGDDLVIATHGRGFYVMDDIEPLRELAGDGRAGTRLYTPAIAIRARPSGFTGTPKPKDESMAANPPDGAFIDYTLAADARGPVVIEIQDAAGAAIRRYSSADIAPPPDPGKIAVAPEWLVTPAPPSALAGQHRLAWDLHWAIAPALADVPWQTGVWAPPGRYTAVLIVDGATFRQPLEVRPDPRVKASPESYRREFVLARHVEADLARTVAALAEVAKAGQEARTAALVDPRRMDSLTALAERLTGLEAAADGADGGPSPDAESGYAAASRTLAATLARWTALKTQMAVAKP